MYTWEFTREATKDFKRLTPEVQKRIVKKIQRVHPPAFKAKVALETTKEEKTITQLFSLFSVHPTQIKQWRTILEHEAETLFSNGHKRAEREKDELK